MWSKAPTKNKPCGELLRNYDLVLQISGSQSESKPGNIVSDEQTDKRKLVKS